MHKRVVCHDLFHLSIYLSIGDVFLLLPHPSVRAWTEIDSLGWMAAVIVTRDVEGVDAEDDSSVLRLRRRVRMCSDCICRNISALALLNVIVCTCLQRRQFNFECRGSQSVSPSPSPPDSVTAVDFVGQEELCGSGSCDEQCRRIECVDLKINWGEHQPWHRPPRSLRFVALP